MGFFVIAAEYLALAAVFAGPAAAQGIPSEVTLFKNVVIFDGNTGLPRPPPTTAA